MTARQVSNERDTNDEPVATLKVTFPSRELRDKFKATCALNGKNMNEAIIEFVQQYVEHGRRMGEPTENGFVLLEPNIQVFECKPKAEAAAAT